MTGSEKEFVDKVMSMHPPNLRDRNETYSDHAHGPHSERSLYGGDLRDFWRTSSAGPSEVHDPGDQSEEGGDHMTNAGFHHLQERSARPYSAMEQLAMLESSNMEEAAEHHRSMNPNQTFYENYSSNPYLENMNASSSSHVATAYMEFFNPSCVRADVEVKPNHGVEHSQMWTLTPNQHQGAQYSPDPQVASPVDGHHFTAPSSGGSMPSSAEMDDLRRQLTGKCSRSNDLLSAMTWSANAAIRRHGKQPSHAVDNEAPAEEAGDPVADDEHQGPGQGRDLLRAAIVDHPSYSELVVAHISIFKIGAPRALIAKLDDLVKKYQRYQDVRETSKIGQDLALDHFMRSYIDLLTKFRDDVEEPYTKFMQYKDKVTKELEDICGHYVETAPDEEDNYGYDFRSILDGTHYSDEQETLDDEMGVLYPIDVDESIIVDPNAPDEELKKQLRRKYGRQCIAGLKAEFTRVKKKGKLPNSARTILKDWFNQHSHWPYPSEAEKLYLQKLCGLNGKQINNWFINERKRHWSCEGKCMHPNQKFYYDADNNNNGRDNQYQ